MKSKYMFIGIYCLLILVLGMSLYNIFYPRNNTLGNQYIILYQPLLNNITLIEDNMNKITTGNKSLKWVSLKDFKMDDKKLEETYNLLISDISACYLQATDLKNKRYDNIKILSFKNKKSVSEKDLVKLSKKENCLKNFDKYNSLILSDDPVLAERIKAQISIIIDYNGTAFNHTTFYDLLYDELITINKMASLSNWLKVEYYSRKM